MADDHNIETSLAYIIHHIHELHIRQERMLHAISHIAKKMDVQIERESGFEGENMKILHEVAQLARDNHKEGVRLMGELRSHSK